MSLLLVDELVFAPPMACLSAEFFIIKTPWKIAVDMKVSFHGDRVIAVELGVFSPEELKSQAHQIPKWKQEIENRLQGRWTHPLRFSLNGTPFQQKVWMQLCRIEWSENFSYSEVAEKIGHSNATRAVANAIGANRFAGFIPCHRVLPKAGGVGGYRWGTALKKSMLSYESSSKKPILLVRWDL
ncbi:MAG: methylated-DNA--[protein]-cysteine S-methyltransferase [Oligoflexales bacterium]